MRCGRDGFGIIGNYGENFVNGGNVVELAWI
jgi:hypothetical protein